MIRLFTSHYPERNERRCAELLMSLASNLENPAIDSVHLLLERVDAPPEHKKLQTRRIDHRPTYNDFFQWAAELKPAESDLTVIANSDICFDASIKGMDHALLPSQCAVLSRWNVGVEESPVLFDRNDSQDVWIFRGPLKDTQGTFCVGVPRCDNRILFELKSAGYAVINPAFSIRAYHLHAGERVEYPTDNQLHFVDPPYAYMWPHNLWSLPRTLVHNLHHPEARIGWRLDRRMLARFLPLRIARRVASMIRRGTV